MALNSILRMGWVKMVLVGAGGVCLPVLISAGSDLLWLHDHRTEAPQLIESYRNDHYEIQELKRDVDRLVVSVKELTSEIREEREERLRGRR